ncbi:MAG: TerC family protein, partial [Bacteroidales bacterium]|nr:TerC family protein [Bacteroidales bacterium]
GFVLGILGAIVLRFLFIFTGAALIQRFEWILYIFGAYLVYVGVKMFLERNKKEAIEAKDHFMVKFLGKRMNITPDYEGNKFVVRRNGKLFVTPLLIVLIFIEFSDVIFALDSIPAIFSVTQDPYVVFFSNIFAILGLRSLFFFLIKIIDKFYYLKAGISILLAFIGIKLLMHEYLHVIGFKTTYSLYFILTILSLSIIFSLIRSKLISR